MDDDFTTFYVNVIDPDGPDPPSGCGKILAWAIVAMLIVAAIGIILF